MKNFVYTLLSLALRLFYWPLKLLSSLLHTPSLIPALCYYDYNGDPVTSGRLYFYAQGNTDKLINIYADVDMCILHPNPVILDSNGAIPTIFFQGSATVELFNGDDHLWSREVKTL